jgi:hypothetical protein
VISRKNRTNGTALSLFSVSLIGVALVTASNAQTPRSPEHCPGDTTVSIHCRLKGTLVKKWVCETSRGRGVSSDLDEAVRRACEERR